ncbi:MAG: response regulator transcription factor, partial [Xanthomonadaceae bacterium]|nr:response regulator transcription factor [Xanthomonadaceae bacterium]
MNQNDILLIEDNPDDAELTRIAFAQAGIDRQLVVVRDGAEALDYLFAKGQYAGRDVRQLPAIVLL